MLLFDAEKRILSNLILAQYLGFSQAWLMGVIGG